MEKENKIMKQLVKIELQARKATFVPTDENGKVNGESIDYNQYFVVVKGIEIPVIVPKSEGKIAKTLLKECFE